MLETIIADNRNLHKYIDMAKDKNSEFRLMGFGHRVYKNYDPRAKIIKECATACWINTAKKIRFSTLPRNWRKWP